MLNLIHKLFTLILNQQGLLNSVFRLTQNALLYKNTGTIHADIKLGKVTGLREKTTVTLQSRKDAGNKILKKRFKNEVS